jgi:Kef-type K+ transport system membrane component KefB/mannitol/fructose-specific phosphotransferase system IIA component (Ntr-type)/nucleotide-binding universal stress UspA family protein
MPGVVVVSMENGVRLGGWPQSRPAGWAPKAGIGAHISRSMPALAIPLSLPLTNPVLIFALAMVLFLVAPVMAERLRAPGILGIIVAGALVGPHGLNLLDRGQTVEVLGTVGLLYLMFLAGVEMDLHGFRRTRWQSVLFGAVSFLIPLALGWAAGSALGFTPLSAVLLGAMLGSHTLLAYPLALSMGIGRNRAVTAAVGGTIIADTAALLVLAFVATSARGALGAAFWVRMSLSLALFAALILWGMPRLARWYFRRESTGTAAEFTFVMTLLFVGAVLALVVGVEPIIGAFLVGLALNALIPSEGLLSNRIHFTGEAFLIPFFLLSVGMLVDVRALLGDARAWLLIGTLLAVGIPGKWLAARVAGAVFGYTPEERLTVFGLSVSRASATLAIALVGHDLGLFDEVMESGVVVLMMATCFLGPWAVQKFGRAVALDEERRPYDPREAPARILLPMSNPRTAPALLDLALLIREERNTEPLFALTVVPEEGESAVEYVANAEKMLSRAVTYGASAGVVVQPLTRVDQNFASGIARGAVETRSTTLVIGWDGRTSRQWVFGSVLDQVLENSTQEVLVAKLAHPLNTTRRLVVLVPAGSDHATGFFEAVATVKRLAQRLVADVVLVTVQAESAAYLEQFRKVRPAAPVTAREAPSWGRALAELRELLRPEDLVVVLSARPNTVAWDPYLQRLPARLAALVPESFVIVYPTEGATAATPAREDHGLPVALARTRIVPRITGRSAHAALDALLERQFPNDLGRRRDVLRTLLHGSREGFLELAPGVAVAHTRLDFVKSPVLFLGRCDGIALPGLERPCHLLFLLLSPADQPGEHLAALADVARLVASPERLDALLAPAEPPVAR